MSEKIGTIEAYPQVGDQTIKKVSEPRPWWKFGGKDISHVSVNAGYELPSETSSVDESTGESLVKNVNNVWDAPEAAELYKPIAGFEGTHRFDPSATWTVAEEKALVRRVSSYSIHHPRVSMLKLTIAQLVHRPPCLYHVLRAPA